jgi:hypothetical protein
MKIDRTDKMGKIRKGRTPLTLLVCGVALVAAQGCAYIQIRTTTAAQQLQPGQARRIHVHGPSNGNFLQTRQPLYAVGLPWEAVEPGMFAIFWDEEGTEKVIHPILMKDDNHLLTKGIANKRPDYPISRDRLYGVAVQVVYYDPWRSGRKGEK